LIETSRHPTTMADFRLKTSSCFCSFIERHQQPQTANCEVAVQCSQHSPWWPLIHPRTTSYGSTVAFSHDTQGIVAEYFDTPLTASVKEVSWSYAGLELVPESVWSMHHHVERTSATRMAGAIFRSPPNRFQYVEDHFKLAEGRILRGYRTILLPA
jgi:hypothetical protein